MGKTNNSLTNVLLGSAFSPEYSYGSNAQGRFDGVGYECSRVAAEVDNRPLPNSILWKGNNRNIAALHAYKDF